MPGWFTWCGLLYFKDPYYGRRIDRERWVCYETAPVCLLGAGQDLRTRKKKTRNISLKLFKKIIAFMFRDYAPCYPVIPIVLSSGSIFLKIVGPCTSLIPLS